MQMSAIGRRLLSKSFSVPSDSSKDQSGPSGSRLASSRPRKAFRRLVIGLLALVSLGFATVVQAGGGPERVLLIVNRNSADSLTIANHYVALRAIPANNLLYLDWTSGKERTPVEEFWKGILQPTIDTILARGIDGQIDYVVYSADFPWAIDFSSFLGDQKPPPQFTPIGSINGLTYLWMKTRDRDPNLMQFDANRYAIHVDMNAKGASIPTRAFGGALGWGNDGERLEAGGRHYLLSTMLGVTSGRGNSLDEVIRYLRSSAAADATHPAGTIYYARNSDVRSTTREPGFHAASRALVDLGVNSEIVDSVLPDNKTDVAGLMFGIADFDWSASGAVIQPGAICEHLTSSGGVLSANAGQTPLSELLRHGAAGASGAVTEPYAIQAKFPLPWMHVHYAKGSSLAEAFYQSVTGPYQLLIVGDPLCRPWAKIPQVTIPGLPTETPLSGKVTLTTRATVTDGSVDRLEWFLDGLRQGTLEPGATLEFDTRLIADGYHELRVVAFEASEVESQGRAIVPLVIRNRDRWVEFSLASPEDAVTKIRWGQPTTLQAQAPGAAAVVFVHGRRSIARAPVENGTASVTFDPRELGAGPVELQACALGFTGVDRVVYSNPMIVEVEADSDDRTAPAPAETATP